MDTAVWPWEGYRLPGRIYQVTLMQCEGPYSYPAHRHHNQWEVVYVSRGRFRHRVGHQVLDQREGTFLLVRENDVHSLAGSGFTFYNLAFPVTLWEGLGGLLFPGDQRPLEALRLRTAPPSADLDPGERMEFEATLDRLLQTYDPVAFLGFWARLVQRCLAEGRGMPTADVGGGEGHIDRQGNPGQPSPAWLTQALGRARKAPVPPDLATWVGWCGFSPEHVARTVRRVWGKTPTQLLNDVKLDRATALLAQTNRGVQEIGWSVGFSSPNHFHKCFRLRHGCTPREYRQALPRPHRD